MKEQLKLEFETDIEGLPLDRQQRMNELCESLEVQNFSKIQEGFMTAITGKPCVDVFKIEDRLGIPEDQSFDEYIEKHYGVYTRKLIDSLI